MSTIFDTFTKSGLVPVFESEFGSDTSGPPCPPSCPPSCLPSCPPSCPPSSPTQYYVPSLMVVPYLSDGDTDYWEDCEDSEDD